MEFIHVQWDPECPRAFKTKSFHAVGVPYHTHSRSFTLRFAHPKLLRSEIRAKEPIPFVSLKVTSKSKFWLAGRCSRTELASLGGWWSGKGWFFLGNCFFPFWDLCLDFIPGFPAFPCFFFAFVCLCIFASLPFAFLFLPASLSSLLRSFLLFCFSASPFFCFSCFPLFFSLQTRRNLELT